MESPPVTAILEFESVPGVVLERFAQHVELRLQKNGARIVVTVPLEVLEWFVAVTDVSTGEEVSDWWDYAGYDDTPHDELAVAMQGEIRQFVSLLIARPLRFQRKRRLFGRKLVVEWCRDGEWIQALPLTMEALDSDDDADESGEV